MDLDVKKRLEKDKVIEKIIISTLRYRPAREIHFPTARPDIFDYEIVCRFEPDKEDGYTPSFDSNERGY